jgi:hypothetical protein
MVKIIILEEDNSQILFHLVAVDNGDSQARVQLKPIR